MDLVLQTAPDEADILNLVPLADLKANERIFHAMQDALLTRCIKSAYAFLDGRDAWLNRAILTQAYKLYLPKFCDTINLPLPPLISVDAVKYVDTDGVEQTLATSVYEVSTDDGMGKISRVSGEQWPATKVMNRAVTIEFTAGFGDAADIAFPAKERLRQAIIFLASHFYRNPAPTFAEPRTVAVDREVKYGLEHLIGFMRVPPDHS